jgi:N-dimethylarginine dimethylaminohydrolase
MISEVAPIQTLLLKRPGQAWIDRDNVRRQWAALNYTAEPDFDRGVAEYESFVETLRRIVPAIRFLREDGRTGLDSIYVRDAAVATERGIILARMGKELRRGEPGALGDFLVRSGVPVLGSIHDPGTLEGGDVVRLDGETYAVGHGYRTNAEGIRQFRKLTSAFVREVVAVPLPHWEGPGDVLHLMSLLSPVDARKLLVYSRLLSVPFRRSLLDRGFELLEVPDAEFPTMGGNVLSLEPGKCLALSGNPRTREVLERAGIEVLTYDGREISVKGAGGPTCLTQPLRFDPTSFVK